MQLRDYLHRSLYDPTEGYFTASKSTIPVGSVGKPLQFNKLLGQADYLSAVKQHYNHLQVSVPADHSIWSNVQESFLLFKSGHLIPIAGMLTAKAPV